MMLCYMVIALSEFFLSHKQIDLVSTQSGSSFKDQLTLETQYHPSFIIRSLLKRLLSSLEQGIPLKSVLSQIGLPTQDLDLDWNDLQKILHYMTLQHPQAYPFLNLFRFLGLCVMTQTLIQHDHTMMMKLGLLATLLVSYLQYQSWLTFKMTSIRLFLLSRNPLIGCELKHNIPTPVFLKKQRLITLWQHCFTLRVDLKKTIALFHSYYEYSAFREAKRLRQQLSALIDIFFVVMFVGVIDSNFKQLYSPSIS